MKFNFNSYDTSRQSISYCEVDKCKAVIKLKKCLQEIKEIAYDGYNNGQTSYATVQCEKIINIINEVENEG